MMAGVLKVEYAYRMDTLSSDCLNTYPAQICVLSEYVSWEYMCDSHNYCILDMFRPQ